MTRSKLRGMRTSGVELTNVSPHGLWLLLDERELFLGFKEFPWFEDATIHELRRIERPSPHHLHWPALDVDLAVESIEHPERYQLTSRMRPDKRIQRKTKRPESRASAVPKK